MLRTQSSVTKALLRHGMKSLMRTCVVPPWIDDDIPQSDWAPASLRQRRSAWHRHPAHLSTQLARLRLGNWGTGKTGTGMGATTNLEDWSRLQQTLGVYYIYIYLLIYLDIKDQKGTHDIHSTIYIYWTKIWVSDYYNYNPWLVFTSLCSRSFLDHPEPSSFFMGFSKHQMTLNSIIFPQISQ